jgi:chorismate synthase
MASNSFGQIFRITTFGESHGAGIGVIIDGCPSGIDLSIQEINESLAFRRPGQTIYTSTRAEPDLAEIFSGVFEGKTTGAPIAILIRNKDADSSQYEAIKDLYRPGHANFTYLGKYGIFDHRGGGRSSARETAARVAAGVVAKKVLAQAKIDCVAYISEIGSIEATESIPSHLNLLRKKIHSSPIFCPDLAASKRIQEKLEEVRKANDSLGGIVACIAHLPSGLGDPVYAKLEAKLASAMLSIPASKGFEIGCGFQSARMLGSEHNDPFDLSEEGIIQTATNNAGGTLGGISTGAPLYFRVAFKPTSSIKKAQQTVNRKGERQLFQLPEIARHDPCVAIRAVPVVEAMCALVLADALLMNRVSVPSSK